MDVEYVDVNGCVQTERGGKGDKNYSITVYEGSIVFYDLRVNVN